MKIVRGRYPPLPSHYSADLHALVEELLQGKASERVHPATCIVPSFQLSTAPSPQALLAPLS